MLTFIDVEVSLPTKLNDKFLDYLNKCKENRLLLQDYLKGKARNIEHCATFYSIDDLYEFYDYINIEGDLIAQGRNLLQKLNKRVTSTTSLAAQLVHKNNKFVLNVSTYI